MRALIKDKPRFRQTESQRGSVLMEMAVLLPVVLLLLLGSVDFARGWVHANAAANAAHAGAQFGAQSKSHAKNAAAIEAVVMRDLEASSMLKAITNADGTVVNTGQFSVETENYCICDNGTEVDCDVKGSCGAGATNSSQIHIRVRVNSTFETLFDYPGIPAQIRIDRQASLRAR
jgi:Flp pilus assembly protein TadG